VAPPFEVLDRRVLCRHGHNALRADELAWPDGHRAAYAVVEQRDATLVVAVSQRRTTFLVRQWRHSWDADSWEVPAGTMEPGEEPLTCAKRELAEEAGLVAERWRSLGTARAVALSTLKYHLFLARDLTATERRPEVYEQDMVVREVPFRRALADCREGGIQHAASIAALFRAEPFV
jgi:ADP-ribose pyrophosphatase